MTPYSGSNNSTIESYETGADYIDVRFKSSGKVYRYSYDSATPAKVEEMKRLAQAGSGLYRFIRDNAYHDFETNFVPSQANYRSYEDRGIAPMPEELHNFDVRPYLEGNAGVRYGNLPIVEYTETVTDDDKIPGLIEFVRAEFHSILAHMSGTLEIDLCPEMKIVLSDRLKEVIYGDLSDVDIIRKAAEIADRNGAVTKEEFAELRGRRKVKNTVTGEYSSDTRTITIYYRVLSAEDGLDGYLAKHRNVLTHETMHYAHDMYIGGRIFNDSSVHAIRVKEALADFYAYIYCIDEHSCIWNNSIASFSKEVAEKRYKLWQKNAGTAWPYAYALYLFKTIDGRKTGPDIDKFCYVRDISRVNMEEAYYALTET